MALTAVKFGTIAASFSVTFGHGDQRDLAVPSRYGDEAYNAGRHELGSVCRPSHAHNPVAGRHPVSVPTAVPAAGRHSGGD